MHIMIIVWKMIGVDVVGMDKMSGYKVNFFNMTKKKEIIEYFLFLFSNVKKKKYLLLILVLQVLQLVQELCSSFERI